MITIQQEPTLSTHQLTCCQSCARVVCRGRGGAAWQAEGAEVGEAGSRQGGGRAVLEGGTGEGEEEGRVAPTALPGARSEA